MFNALKFKPQVYNTWGSQSQDVLNPVHLKEARVFTTALKSGQQKMSQGKYAQ